jgi:hypothetical protein
VATASTTTSTETQGAALPVCTAAALHLSFLAQQGGMDHGELGFALENVGSGSCHTYGYPGIEFLDRTGASLPTVPVHTTHDFFGSSSESVIVLAPGQRASFRLGVTHGIATSAPCATAYALQVIPPDNTQTLRTAIPDGAFECRVATVSPLRAGTSAYP